MKKILIEGVEYYYKIGYNLDDTHFYTKKEYVGKKYYFFGKKVVKSRYIYKFMLCFNIESPYSSKQETNNAIQRELAILKRRVEIERGEIL